MDFMTFGSSLHNCIIHYSENDHFYITIFIDDFGGL